jgi:hypothetical protein
MKVPGSNLVHVAEIIDHAATGSIPKGDFDRSDTLIL